MGRYLVTGGAGFIGSHLCHRLCAEGHAVRVLDDLSTGRRENLAEILGEIEFVEGDIRDAALLAEVVQQVDCVLHHAAIVSVPASSRAAPRRSGSQRRGNAAAVGSGAAGRGAAAWFSPVRPQCMAIIRKCPSARTCCPNPSRPTRFPRSWPSTTLECTASSTAWRWSACATSMFLALGRCRPSPYSGVISIFCSRGMRVGESPTVCGDGHQSRDFVYVGDVVEANVRASTTPGGRRADIQYRLWPQCVAAGIDRCAQPDFGDRVGADVRPASGWRYPLLVSRYIARPGRVGLRAEGWVCRGIGADDCGVGRLQRCEAIKGSASVATIVDGKKRIPFMRGMLGAHYLIERGFSYEDAPRCGQCGARVFGQSRVRAQEGYGATRKQCHSQGVRHVRSRRPNFLGAPADHHHRRAQERVAAFLQGVAVGFHSGVLG